MDFQEMVRRGNSPHNLRVYARAVRASRPVEMAVTKGLATRENLKIGIRGEQGAIRRRLISASETG